MIDNVRGFFSATLSVRVLSSDGQLHCLFPQLLTDFLCPRLEQLRGVRAFRCFLFAAGDYLREATQNSASLPAWLVLKTTSASRVTDRTARTCPYQQSILVTVNID